MQNKYLRLITYNNQRTSVRPLLTQFKLLNIDDLYKINVCKIVWCAINTPKGFPTDVFCNVFKRKAQIHHHNTRYRNDLHSNVKNLKGQG